MKTVYRSVWISDVHLSSGDCRADRLYTFLDAIRCDYLYLVGDIVDVWAMRNRWHWPRQYNEVVHKLLKRSRRGAKVIYIPGNHDDFFRGFVGYRFGDVEIRQNAIHETADGRRLLVIHGDEFDSIVCYRPWLSLLGCRLWRRLLLVNQVVNWTRRLVGKPPLSLAHAVSAKVSRALKHLENFEQLVTAEAARQGCAGVICGHVHRPALAELNGVTYANCGDWVRHCTALVEHADGRLELIHWPEAEPPAQLELFAEGVAPGGQARARPPQRRRDHRSGRPRAPMAAPHPA